VYPLNIAMQLLCKSHSPPGNANASRSLIIYLALTGGIRIPMLQNLAFRIAVQINPRRGPNSRRAPRNRLYLHCLTRLVAAARDTNYGNPFALRCALTLAAFRLEQSGEQHDS